MMLLRIAPGVRSGSYALRSPANPATTGDAAEVPSNDRYVVFTPAVVTPDPPADTSDPVIE